MKTKIIITLFILISATLISLNYFQSPVGPHDGIVKQTGDYNIEMKNTSFNFYTYLLDKKLRPISNQGVSCEVKFIFPDSSSINIALKPFGKDGFTLEAGSLKFCSCRIYFDIFGKSVSAPFENESPIVQKK